MKDVFGVVAEQVLDALNGSSALHEAHLRQDFFEPLMREASNETPAQVLNDWVHSIGAVQDKLGNMPQPRPYDTFDYDDLKKRYPHHKSMDVRENPDRYAEHYHSALVEIVGRRLVRAEQ